MSKEIQRIHPMKSKLSYMDIYNSQLRYGFRYLVYPVSPLLLERLTSISILLYQFERQAYVSIHLPRGCIRGYPLLD